MAYSVTNINTTKDVCMLLRSGRHWRHGRRGEEHKQYEQETVQDAFRVLKQGGTIVITEAFQLGDRPTLDRSIIKFGEFHEPWYPSYVSTNFARLWYHGSGGKLVPHRK